VTVENRTGAFEFAPDPDLENLFTVWARKIGLSIRTVTVGTVQAYDPATQEASVMVDMLEVRKVIQQTAPGVDPNETNRVRASAPILLTNVPVLVTGPGNGTDYLSFPVTTGCSGALVVLDRSKDTWVNRTALQPVDPVKSAIHSLSDCFLVTGLTDRAHRISTPTDLTAAVLESAQIKLGRSATLGVARETDPVVPTEAMATWALLVETTINVLAPGTFTPLNSFATTVLNSFGTISQGSTKVKAE
jgi:hypothetical protein